MSIRVPTRNPRRWDRPGVPSSTSPDKETTEYSREERLPSENIHNAAGELAKESRQAGAVGADPDPRGGSGLEPPPADGEGQGYSMQEVAKIPADNAKECQIEEEAGVQDVE